MTAPDSLDEWFVREVLAHEAALTRYIGRAWPIAADVADLRHDAYVRVFEAAAVHGRPGSPKAFLFSTAKNLMVDRARRNRVVPIDLLEDIDSLNVLIDELSPERRLSARQHLMLASDAFNALPPKCREVVWMKRVLNLSHREIASKMSITVGTVEKHIVKGLRLLTEFMQAGEGGAVVGRSGSGSTGREDQHGK